MSYYDSPEFRRQYNAATDSAIKTFFRGLNSLISAVINGITAMVYQVLGK